MNISKIAVGAAVVIAGMNIIADTDLLPIIRQAEQVIEKTYADEELTQKYYKDKVKKVLDGSASDEEKAAALNRIIASVRKSSSKTAPAVPAASGNMRDSLMIVAGEKGVGSGFVTVFNGKKVAVTNIHVLMGNQKIKFLDCNNRRLECSRINFAADRDIAIIELSETSSTPALPMEAEVTHCAIGESVLVSGNSQGAGAVTKIEGALKGIGPKVVEVSAPFVQGNSGSPIIAVKTGRVIGVATFAVKAPENWVNKGSGFDKVRRFGTRIDNLDPASLQPFSAREYSRDLSLYRRLKEANATAMNVITDFRHNKGILVEARYMEDETMKKIARRWNDALTNPRFGTSYMNTLTEIIRHIEGPAGVCKKREIHYGFIRGEIDTQLKFNEALVKQLNGLKATLDEYRKRLSKQGRGY